MNVHSCIGFAKHRCNIIWKYVVQIPVLIFNNRTTLILFDDIELPFVGDRKAKQCIMCYQFSIIKGVYKVGFCIVVK